MAFESFPDNLLVKTIETDELVECGTLEFPDAMKLQHIIFTIYKHGAAGGTERLRAKIYADSGLTDLLSTSDWVNLSSFADGSYWIGRVRFDFSSLLNIKPGISYYAAFETDNYTRDADDYYLGLVLDYPLSVNVNSYASIAMEVYGIRGVSVE